ncbi:hypothetical protein HanRHA438_Chr10g0462351 [Helianthus annuus]|nr:hypothetical protein HanRHA438_Chr10g0462351 [Helianthus annuus]
MFLILTRFIVLHIIKFLILTRFIFLHIIKFLILTQFIFLHISKFLIFTHFIFLHIIKFLNLISFIFHIIKFLILISFILIHIIIILLHIFMFLILLSFNLLHIFLILIHNHDLLLLNFKCGLRFLRIVFDMIFTVKKLFIFFLISCNTWFPRSINQSFTFHGVRSTSHQQQSILWWHTNTHSCFIFMPFNPTINNLQIFKHMSSFPNNFFFFIILLIFISNNQLNIPLTTTIPILHRH